MMCINVRAREMIGKEIFTLRGGNEMKNLIRLSVIVMAVVICASATDIYAGWIDNGVTVSNNADDVRSCEDGAGGAIIAWRASTEIYARGIDSDGTFLWGPVCICNEDYAGYYGFDIAADGEGGAVIVWADERVDYNINIYAQRINSNGDLVWPEDTPVCTAEDFQKSPCVAITGSDANIAWEDHRASNPGHRYIYAQRLRLSSGSVRWTTDGIAISADDPFGTSIATNPKIVSDGYGGVIISFTKQKNGADLIYAQRVDASGEIVWELKENGAQAFYAENYDLTNHKMIADGLGGAIFVCDDHRGQYAVVRKQKLYKVDGSRRWGVAAPDEILCGSCSHHSQSDPHIVMDTDGNPVVVYRDDRNDKINIYAQKLTPGGGCHIDYGEACTGGKPVCDGLDGERGSPKIIAARGDGTIITWYDEREGTYDDNIYAQMLDEYGEPLWDTNGYSVCVSPGTQSDPRIVTDGDGGAIIVWRGGGVYAARIIPEIACRIDWIVLNLYDVLIPGTDIVGCPDGDNTENHDPAVNYNQKLQVCVRDLEGLVDGSIGEDDITLDKPQGSVTFWKNGDIIADDPLITNGETPITHASIGGCGNGEPIDVAVRIFGIRLGYAEDINVKSFDLDNDGDVDLVDFSLFSAAWQSQGGDPNFTPCADYDHDDDVDIGDLAMFAPCLGHSFPFGSGQMLASGESSSSGVILKMQAMQCGKDDSDGREQVRLVLEGVADITAAMFLLNAKDLRLDDFDWNRDMESVGKSLSAPVMIQGEDCLCIGLFDIEASAGEAVELGTLEIEKDNYDDLESRLESAFAFGAVLDREGRIIYVSEADAEENSGTPELRYHLGDNYPNPFNPTTTIEFSIGKDCHADLSIYSVSGKLVKTLVNGMLSGDQYRVVWDGTNEIGNPVASGIYFYSLETERFKSSKKLVLLR
jgi:hypothetical protein